MIGNRATAGSAGASHKTKRSKTVFSAVIVGWAVVLLAAGMVAAGIQGSDHDFSGRPWSGGQLCVACHDVHGMMGMLWNHEFSSATYTISNSPTLDATDLGQPAESSARCLGCHDGTVAVDSFGGNAGWEFISGAARIGTDLRSHHPVSFTYDSALAAVDGRLFDPATTPSGLGGTIDGDMLDGGNKLECSSCHDPHDSDGNSYMLVKSNIGGALCMTCHDLGVAGSAHDFSSYGWSGGQTCSVCHDHQPSSATYTVSTSPTLDAVDLGQPDGASAECLSCHDGTVPVDSFGGNSGSVFMTGPAVIGTDLKSHHPVSFTYDSALAALDGRLNDPATAPSGLGGTIAGDLLRGGKLQCSSCHDQHGGGGNPYMLVKPVAGTALCATCHVQSGGPGHHLPGRADPWNNCTMCHGVDLRGDMGPSCMGCHNDFQPPDPPLPGHHMPNRDDPFAAGNCTMCHGADLTGGMGPSCFTCHDQVWADNVPPLADPGGPYIGGVGSGVQFDGSGSADADGTIVSYDWDFGDGGTGGGESPSHTYAAAGTYTVSLTVTDDVGLTDTQSTTAAISAPANPPPVVDPGGPYSGTVGQPVQFDASGTYDPESDPLVYLWNFGDGTPPAFPSQVPTATHTYAEAGTYTAQLAVTDGVNDPVLAEVTVEISDAPGPWGDTWHVKVPFLFSEFTVRFEDFAGFLLVETTYADGRVSIAIGMEIQGVIFWMDIEGAIYFGNIDRGAGTMSGIVLGHFAGSSVWFAERL